MTPIPLKRLTPRDINEGPLPVPLVHTQLFIVYGVVTASVQKKSKFDVTRTEPMLMGRFKAVRARDRQEFTGERLYLPDRDYQTQIANANCPDRETGEVNEISIAYNIGYKPASSSPAGYTFTVQPVIDYKVQDALADVEKQINFDKVLPALAAPEKMAEKTSAKK